MSSSSFPADSMNSMRMGGCSVSTSILVVCITWWAPKPAIARVAVAPETPLCSRNVRMASHSDPKWCCVSSLTKIVTFFAVPFWSIPTPPAVLHQLSFFDRCEDFVPFVGQAIAFCGLSCLGKARQPDRRQKPIVCPTIVRETTLSIRAASTPSLRSERFPRLLKPLQVRAELRRPLIAAALHQPFHRAHQFIQAPPGFLLDSPQRAIDALFPLRAEPAQVLINQVGDGARKMPVHGRLDHPHRQHGRQQFPVPVENSSDPDIGCARIQDSD